MAAKRQNQTKLMKFVTIPVKILAKARDLYVKSMTSCASRANYAGSMPLVGQLPKSYSTGSSISNDAEDYRDLIRAASARSLGHRNEIDMLLQQAKLQAAAGKPLPKSISVGMGGFMGRIDEDTAEDDGSVGGGVRKVGKTAPEMYPRSKSYAVGKTRTAF